MTSLEFIIYCKALCLIYDCSETSGIRTPARNKLVGGAALSTHQVEHGWGMDLVPDKNSLGQKTRIADAAIALGMWTLIEDDHVHVGYRID